MREQIVHSLGGPRQAARRIAQHWGMEDRFALLCARDPVVEEIVEVVAAAQQVEVRVVRESDRTGHDWAAAGLRLVSTEVAVRWDRVAPHRAHLIGTSTEELARCSARLGLPVLPLPDTDGRLAQLLAGVGGVHDATGRLVALVGASGGLGVSTLAVGLALAAARAGESSAVVDLAQHGGGLDLLLGMETADGARWADLAAARGTLGDIGPGLPAVEGARVLTQDRSRPCVPGSPAVDVVVAALRRAHGIVVADCDPTSVPDDADRTLVVVGADVRSVAAGRMLAELRGLAPTGLIVRAGNGRGLPPDVVGRALGAPVVAVVGHDKALPRLAELGLPPVGGPARRFSRDVATLLREVSGD